MTNALLNLARSRKQPQQAPAEDKRSLARTIAGNVLSPLAAVGNVLDLPGSSVRDMLTGQNPFDQYLTPTKHENRATGREVNTHLFGTAPNDPHRWEWADVGGFATEVLTDPLLGVSGLASGTGRALRGTGKATELFRFGVPFTNASVPVGKMAAQGLDNLASKAWQTKIPFSGGSSAVGRKFIPHSASSRADEAEKMIMVSTAKLDDAWGKGLPEMYIGPGQPGIDGRRAKFEDFLKTNKPIEASRITFNPQTGQAQFADGRHRFAVMRDAGDKQVAVMVPRSEAQAAQEALGAPSTGTTFGDVADSAKVGIKGLFDYASGGSFTKAGQKFNQARTGLVEDLAPEAFMRSKSLHDEMLPVQDEFLKHNPTLSPDDGMAAWNDILTHSQELAGRAGNHKAAFEQAYQDVLNVPAPVGLSDFADKPLKSWASGYRQSIDEARDWGQKIGKHDHEHTAYTARQASKEILESQDKSASHGGLFSHENSASREDILANVPQLYLRKMIGDTSLGGKSKYVGNNALGGGAEIEKDFGKFLGYETMDPTTFKPITVTPKEHAEQLSEYLGSLDPSVKSIHEFAPAGLLERSQASHARVMANMKTTHDTFKEAIATGATGRTMTLDKAYGKIGMDPERAVAKYAQLNNIPVDQAKQLRVGEDLVDTIATVNKFQDNPPWLDFLGKNIDWFNSMFKSNVTMPFPTFHIRNWISGQHMNLASGHISTASDLRKYMAAYSRAKAIRANPSDPMIREAMAHKTLGHKQAFEDVTLRGTSEIGPGLAGSPMKGYQDAKAFVADPENANPLMDAIPGGKAMRTGYNTVMNTGSNVAQTMEYYNRMPMYLYLREKGMSAKQAAKEVEKLQFDYSKITPFERGVARRMIPFYVFNRRIAPQVAEMLAQRPGGGIAQSIRASNAGRSDEEVMPPQIADTAAVPLGTKPDGSKTFATGFGLAPEAAMPYLAAPADPKGALLNLGASLSPLLKVPMEMASGQTFFQRGPNGGRPLKELDPTIGRTISNVMGSEEPVNILGSRGASQVAEHLASNSPVSRLLTTARTMTDRRKSVLEKANSFLFPVKTTDISPKQQERALIDASNRLADQLGAGTWQNRYFTEERLAQLDRDNPLLAAQARALKQLWNKSKVTAKGEKKGGKTKKARSSKSPERAEVNRLMRAAGM